MYHRLWHNGCIKIPSENVKKPQNKTIKYVRKKFFVMPVLFDSFSFEGCRLVSIHENARAAHLLWFLLVSPVVAYLNSEAKETHSIWTGKS